MLVDLTILALAGALLYAAARLLYRLVQTLMRLAGVALAALFLVAAAALLFPDRFATWQTRLQDTPLDGLIELADETGTALAERLRRLGR